MHKKTTTEQNPSTCTSLQASHLQFCKEIDGVLKQSNAWEIWGAEQSNAWDIFTHQPQLATGQPLLL